MDAYQKKTKSQLISEIHSLKKFISLSDKENRAADILQKCNDLTLINELNSAVIQHKSIDEMLSFLSEAIAENFNCNGAVVYLLNKDGRSLSMQMSTVSAKVMHTVTNHLHMKIPSITIKLSPSSYYFKTIKTGHPLITDDQDTIKEIIYEFTDNKMLRKIVHRIQRFLGIKYVVLFPLISGQGPLGVLDISRTTAFSDTDIHRLQNIVFQVTEILLYHRTTTQKELLLQELQKSYSKIKTLSGLIPICSHCKKIRDDSGYWSQVEKYIGEHTDAVFTHGICPECLKEYYPEFVQEKESKTDTSDKKGV